MGSSVPGAHCSRTHLPNTFELPSNSAVSFGSPSRHRPSCGILSRHELIAWSVFLGARSHPLDVRLERARDGAISSTPSPPEILLSGQLTCTRSRVEMLRHEYPSTRPEQEPYGIHPDVMLFRYSFLLPVTFPYGINGFLPFRSWRPPVVGITLTV